LDGLTTGRIVHFVDQDGRCNAAIIIDVKDVPPGYKGQEGWAGVQVLARGGEITHHPDVHYDDVKKRRGTWHWPERA
jgi:hypothetical protein